ncbi:ABC transporter substrate-binding protein [Eubacteriales bacterium OttesenSCG-928-N13]|nr:ABC transporter substrate-binding protein [Eubacteriales bacterium OttesenSCG-928-N13]
MKKLLALLLAMLMMLVPIVSYAEVSFDDETGEAYVDDTAEPEYTRISSDEFGEFIVGATTTLTGDFFTNMWGNNTVDIDVRHMVHGYSTVVWDRQSSFIPNETIVAQIAAAELESGNKMYTIQIVGDLVYSDGSPITAKDYLFSYLLQAAPQVAEIDGKITNMDHIAGIEEFKSGEVQTISGLRIVDDYTYTVEINQEFLPYFYELSMVEATPYPISVIAPGCEIADEGQGIFVRNTDPSVTEPIFTAETLKATIMDPDIGYMAHPSVVSGPYTLESFDWETREAVFKINPNFKGDWEGNIPTIDNVRFINVKPIEMMDQLKNGEVHLLNKVVSGEDIETGINDGYSDYSSYPRLGFGFISFACEQGPSQFENVREAIAYSLDVPQFVAEYTINYGLPVYGYMGIGQWMYMLISAAATNPPSEDPVEAAVWGTLTMENLNTYEIDMVKAEQLLIDDGWTLNENNEPFVKGTDTVRYKIVDDKPMPLIMKWAKLKDSVAAEYLDEMLVEPLATIGMQIEVTELPFAELLQHYYRQVDRTYDMFYLATDFLSAFDPYPVFSTEDQYQGSRNTTGFRDVALEGLAYQLRSTEPGELLQYCQRWIAFQTYFNDKLPMIPLYSNIYHDFYTPYLQNYNPQEMSWPVALIASFLGEEVVTEDTEPAAE